MTPIYLLLGLLIFIIFAYATMGYLAELQEKKSLDDICDDDLNGEVLWEDTSETDCVTGNANDTAYPGRHIEPARKIPTERIIND